jgi:hypothetical protein
MAKPNIWASKVLALLKGGNLDAAIAQIKVAPTVKDLQALRTDMILARLSGRWRHVDEAVDDNLALLAAPRLHRAP